MSIRSRKNRVYCVVLFVIALATPLQAQGRLSIAADVGLTDGTGRGGEYDNRTLQGLRFSASARLGGERAGIFVEVARESLGSLFGDKLICRMGTNGLCVPSYPQVHGWSTSVGVLIRPRHFLEGRLGVGPARYVTRDQANPRMSAIIGLADIAVYPLSHVGLALAVQEIAFARYSGNDLSVRPFTVALRLR
jgi:hypothetical protein